MTDIVSKLNRLADIKSQADVINIHFDQLHDSILTPEIRAQLDDIEAERTTALEAALAGAKELESEIRAGVAAFGTTVKGSHLMAVYGKGRVSWDDRALSGYAIDHPEILAFRKTGEPSVAIRKV